MDDFLGIFGLNNLFIRDLLVYGILILFVLYVTKQNNMWGTRKGTKNTKHEVRKAKTEIDRRNFVLIILKRFEHIALTLGPQPSEYKLTTYKFNITRSRMILRSVERYISPLELIGILKVVKFTSALIASIGFVLGLNFLLVALAGLFVETYFKVYTDAMIQSEDMEIEKEFPNLYILLYSRLLKGSRVRLAPTLDEYIKSLDYVYGENSHKAIRNFVMDLRKNIEIYGDDSMAVHKMRHMYKSAMLVNFFNLAIQSLRGVNNSEKLLSFKIELAQKRLKEMEQLADKRIARGEKAIWAIFLIVVQFVLLSWAAKADLGQLLSLFGR